MLGPLSDTTRRQRVDPYDRKLRQLLALLLLNEPHRVSVTSLITELWDDAAPRCALTTLQTHVFYLRAEFARKLDVTRGTVARDLLQTHDGGYRIILGDNAFDLREFHRLRTLAQARLTTGDAQGASRLLSEALDQWRGPALLDVDHGRLLRARVTGLDRGGWTHWPCSSARCSTPADTGRCSASWRGWSSGTPVRRSCTHSS